MEEKIQEVTRGVSGCLVGHTINDAVSGLARVLVGILMRTEEPKKAKKQFISGFKNMYKNVDKNIIPPFGLEQTETAKNEAS